MAETTCIYETPKKPMLQDYCHQSVAWAWAPATDVNGTRI